MFPELSASDVPWVTTDQMREVDRLMIELYGIELVQMMENAGRNLADLVSTRFAPASVTVLAGTGGNGGGAMAAARHLHNRAFEVSVTLTNPDRLTPVPTLQREALVRMGVEVTDQPVPSDVVIDGILGYSLSGEPRGRAAELIEWTAGRTIVSLDTPSGLDTTTGETPGAVVEAAATATLAAPKTGLRSRVAVGELYLLDISIPPKLWDDLGVERPPPLAPVSRLV